MLRSLLFLSWACLAWQTSVVVQAEDYGLDCSWPIHQQEESSCGNLLGDRRAVYDEYLRGCREAFGKSGARRCMENEADRLEMSVRQPQSMVNYTNTGFKKIKAPPALWATLQDYWNKNEKNRQIEQWGVGNIYTNNWAAPTYMVSVENAGLRGGGSRLKQKIWEQARPTIEAWTGMKLQPTSLYGIRIYTEGAILAPHVDRLPLVSSCIINVAQDVDEPWVLEVYDRHDRAVNVTMEPGDMVLYESGSLMHGRPFPLKGKYFANIFIHFEPTGQTVDGDWVDLDDFYPPYLVEDSPEIANWERRNPGGWRKNSPSGAHAASNPRSGAHVAAALGDLPELQRLAKEDPTSIHQTDANGWQPLHEAVRAGHLDVVHYLIEQHNADMNAVTHKGAGDSPYHLAKTMHSEDHPVAVYLYGLGAVDISSEL